MRVGMRCVRGDIPDAECQVCALRPEHPCHLTPDLLQMMREDEEPAGDTHSPTRLLGCGREAVFKQQYDWYLDIEYAYPLTRGRMVHALMEGANYPGVHSVVREERLTTCVETKYGKQQFSGKPDLVVLKELHHDIRGGDPEHWFTAKVVDYKSTGEIKHELTEAHLAHQIQVNLYAWLVERELPKVVGYPVKVDELEVAYFDMKKPRRFNSLATLEARGKRLSVRPLEYDTLTLPPIRHKDAAWCEGYIRWHMERRIAEMSDLPPVLEEEDAWKCARCDVYEICAAVARERGEREPAA